MSMVTWESDRVWKLPSIYDIELVSGGRVAVHRVKDVDGTSTAILIVYGTKPEGSDGKLDGIFIDGKIVARGFRSLVNFEGKTHEASLGEHPWIDRFYIDLLRRIAIEGDAESRVWAIETLLEMKV